MKNDILLGRWSRIESTSTPAEIKAMRPIASIKTSSNNIDEQIQEALEATIYVPRKTYKELALRFNVKPSKISAIRYKLLKLNT